MNKEFLGRPNRNIRQWLRDHRPTPGQGKTTFWIDSIQQEPLEITGTLGHQWFIDNGYYDSDDKRWLKNITNAEIGSWVTAIGSSAFRQCTSLSAITIPKSVVDINNYAFGHCSSLDSVAVPDSVASIGKFAFEYCTKLSSVTLPGSVTAIDIGAFRRCPNLSSIAIPESVTVINGYTFDRCTSLNSVVIPKSVAKIVAMTFNGCDQLATIYVDSESEKERVKALYKWPENATFIVRS